jgi:hypothetical protein
MKDLGSKLTSTTDYLCEMDNFIDLMFLSGNCKISVDYAQNSFLKIYTSKRYLQYKYLS